MKKPLMAILIFSLALPGGYGARELTTEQVQQIEALKNERAALAEEIKEAGEKDAARTGGLVKALIGARLELLLTTDVLIRQRVHALESGAPISIEVRATTAAPEEAESLSAEIEAKKEELEAAKKESARYSGGLVKAMKESTVATIEQTLAMLQQRQLIARYGLAMPTAAAASPTGSTEALAGNSSQESEAASPPEEAREGPFGLEAGLAKDDIEALVGGGLSEVEGAAFLYSVKAVPRPHPAFEGYVVLAPPNAGLCQIRAIGVDVKTSSHGIQLKSEYDDLAASLEESYGEFLEVDQLLPGSIWKDPEDWMMGLLKKERFLQAEWSAKNGSRLKNSITRIDLVGRAKRSDTGYLLLQYTFDNKPQCEAEIKKKENASL